MNIVLEYDDETLPKYVNGIRRAPRAHLDAVVALMKRSRGQRPVEGVEPVIERCPLCGYQEREVLYTDPQTESVWPSMAKHLLTAHKVWTPEFDALGKQLVSGSSQDDTVDFDSIDIEGIVVRSLDEVDAPPKPKKTWKKPKLKEKGRRRPGPSRRAAPRGPRRHAPASRHVSAHGHAGRQLPAHPSQLQAQHPQHPQHPSQLPPPAYPPYPPANGASGTPANGAQQGGFFNTIKGLFGNLIPQSQPSPAAPGMNGHHGPPPQQLPLANWYPDPGLQARLTRMDGTSFDAGEVPAGRYQVEVDQGDGFNPIARVDVVPHATHRLYLQGGKIRWGIV